MKKIVVAVTGASGSIYAQRLLQQLAHFQDVEVGVVLSANAADVWETELDSPMDLPFPIYERNDFRAPFASGSAKYEHMVIIPCSMGTMGRIAAGASTDLIGRAADVMLKERRQLICVLRDSPYNLIHIENMRTLAYAGAVVMPASPSFYSRPKDIGEVVDTITHRVLDLMGLDAGGFRWGG